MVFPDRVPTIATLAEHLRTERIDTLWLTSSLFNFIIDEAPETLRPVKQLLTGGEAFQDHHHEEQQSALHRPRKGLWNRIVDYNGTILLAYEKLGWVRNLKIAPQFA